MKREICALLLLAMLAALSVWNIRGADRPVGEIQEHLELSEKIHTYSFPARIDAFIKSLVYPSPP